MTCICALFDTTRFNIENCASALAQLLRRIIVHDEDYMKIQNMAYDYIRKTQKFILESGYAVDDVFFYTDEGGDPEETNAIAFYCDSMNLAADIDDMIGWEENVFQPKMIGLLLQYKPDLSKDNEWKSLLQNYLMLCCADSDFTEEDFCGNVITNYRRIFVFFPFFVRKEVPSGRLYRDSLFRIF